MRSSRTSESIYQSARRNIPRTFNLDLYPGFFFPQRSQSVAVMLSAFISIRSAYQGALPLWCLMVVEVASSLSFSIYCEFLLTA